MTRTTILALALALGSVPFAAAQEETGEQDSQLQESTTIEGEAVVQEEIDASISDVTVEEADLPSLFDGMEDTADRLRTVFAVETFRIVDIGDEADGLPTDIEQLVDEHQEELDDLRNAVQGNGILFTLLDENNVAVTEIVGAEIPEEGSVTIYAFAALI